MRIWITEITEPLPVLRGRRLMRCGLLADVLLRGGHDVTWWSSDFDHISKSSRAVPSGTLKLAAGYRIQLLPGRPYRRNASLARVRHHRAVARAFAVRARSEPVPDLVFSCLPTLELTEAAIRFASNRQIPVVVDVRDCWPDAFLHLVPNPFRSAARALLWLEFRRARFICRRATGLVGVSSEYLAWALRYASRQRTPLDGVFPLGYPREEVPQEQLEQARSRLRGAGVDNGKIIVAFVGSFGRTYDLTPVITIARQLAEAGDSRVQFVLAGDGERRVEWESLAHGLPNIVFAGWLSAAEISALLNSSAVGLAAYARGAPQGLPNKVFEYMAAGLPILSSLRGETEKLLAECHCGLTYDAGSPPSLGTRLTELLQNDEGRREMGRRGLEKFERAFSAREVYEALATHLMQVAKARPS